MFSDPLLWLEIELQCILVSIDHPWDVSTTWLETTWGKFNWLDMILERHTPVYVGPTVDSKCQQKSSHEVVYIWICNLLVDHSSETMTRMESPRLRLRTTTVSTDEWKMAHNNGWNGVHEMASNTWKPAITHEPVLQLRYHQPPVCTTQWSTIIREVL
jgi:hypothetical protein